MTVSRRDFLKFLFFIPLIDKVCILSSVQTSQSYILRPPGARREKEFLKLCIRCGQCIKICPTQVIYPIKMKESPAKVYTPHLIFKKSWCEMCFACQKVCPTSAIAKKEDAKIGVAQINRQTCIAWLDERKYCLICQEVCPHLAIYSDKKRRPHIISSNCVGCGLCEYNCPASSIYVIPLFN